MKLVEFYLAQIYGEEAPLNKIQEVRNHCFDLFQEYQSRALTSHESSQASNEVVGIVDGKRLSSFDQFVVSSRANVDTRSELDVYLEESLLPRTPSFDSLSWWKTNGLKFPTLQKMARDLLAIPVSIVASESAFSTSGRLISPHRSRLHPTTLEALILTSSVDKVSCPTLLEEEEELDSTGLTS
ncbi:zinc finger BED domain-containing protein DAYSLEEPER-like [Nicotiana tabacum]|uniref:Zinc finger BED domain-containing protein DAYSLEEPER-like n=1 Tax=Nicotiana tabacum TaxID=4097 RepID=A0AC58SHM0_TOBAC